VLNSSHKKAQSHKKKSGRSTKSAGLSTRPALLPFVPFCGY
jgi:hypothetical protein